MQRKLAAILAADVVGLSEHYALSYSNGSSDLNDSTSSARYGERGVFARSAVSKRSIHEAALLGAGPAGRDAGRASLHWHLPVRPLTGMGDRYQVRM